MFAQRFDPTAVEPESRKRGRAVDSDSEASGTESSSEVDSGETDGESEDGGEKESDQPIDHEIASAAKFNDRHNVIQTKPSDVLDSSEESEAEETSDSDDSSDCKSSDGADEAAKNDDNMDVDEDDANDYVSKHASVFAKLRKSLNSNQETQEEEIEDVPVQDLVPLPQPELPRDKRAVVNYQHLNSLNWLATPVYAAPEATKPFGEFGLSQTALKALEAAGFKEAFSVQIAVLELLLKDIKDQRLRPDVAGDVLVNASTGSGKTLAYTIPIIEGLKDRVVARVRAIVLVPTKPLINQVRQTFVQLSKGTNLRITSLKKDVSVTEEARKLTTTVPDVIISTPGRLVEHLDNQSIKLTSLRYLVIDEADRLLNQSFQNWCSVLIDKIKADTTKPGKNLSNFWQSHVQKIILSATLTTDAGKLALLDFHQPRLVIVNDKQELVNEIFSVPRTLKEYSVKFGSSKSSLKPVLLAKFLIRENKMSNVLVFTKSNESCIRLSKLLDLIFAEYGSSVKVQYVNSTNNTMAVRNKILAAFASGEINVLVATDLIARGIDLLSISDVVNYDMPNSSREYVHRVGRTARANRDGSAYNLLFGKGEQKWFSRLMRPISRDREVQEMGAIDTSEHDSRVLMSALQKLQEMTM